MIDMMDADGEQNAYKVGTARSVKARRYSL